MSKESILKEFEELKGQFVITDNWDVQRLLAIGDDDQDYYYVYWNGRKSTWSTCVGRVIPLKGKIDDKHYNEFIRRAKLNHWDQPTIYGNKDPEKLEVVEMIKNAKESVELLKDPDKFITEVCWDLN